MIYPSDVNNGIGNAGTGNILIQDAQLEQGLVARDYIETTTAAVEGGITDNVPRLDYTDSSCPALLLEPQRTNELQHSEYVSDWAQNTADITLSDNLSPEGYKNCWRVEGTASGTQVGVATFNRTQGATYTTSIWIRKVSGSDTAIFRDVNNNSNTINITTEWERYTLTSTTSSTTARLYVMVADVGDVIEVYGAQLELGSYATSYIPTYGTSVTRNADECLKTGVSSLIGQTEGTLFAEFEIKSTDTDNFNRVIAIGDGTSNNRIMIFANNDEKPRAFVSDSGATQVSIIGNTSILGGTHKIAFAYKANDFVLYMDGVSLGTDTSGSVPSLSNIYLASAEDGNIRPIEGGLKQTLLFKTRLTNAELADLTTL